MRVILILLLLTSPALAQRWCFIDGHPIPSGSRTTLYSSKYSDTCYRESRVRECVDGTFLGDDNYRYLTCSSAVLNDPWNAYVSYFNPIQINYSMSAEGVATTILVGTIGIILILALRYGPRVLNRPQRPKLAPFPNPQWKPQPHTPQPKKEYVYTPPPPPPITGSLANPQYTARVEHPPSPEPEPEPPPPPPQTPDDHAKEAMRQAILGNRAKAKKHQDEAQAPRGTTYEL